MSDEHGAVESHPFNNPAIACELTMREREALMTVDDWSLNIDRLLATPITAPSAHDIDEAARTERSK